MNYVVQTADIQITSVLLILLILSQFVLGCGLIRIIKQYENKYIKPTALLSFILIEVWIYNLCIYLSNNANQLIVSINSNMVIFTGIMIPFVLAGMVFYLILNDDECDSGDRVGASIMLTIFSFIISALLIKVSYQVFGWGL